MTLNWKPTWPDNPAQSHDFTAMDDGNSVGRIYRLNGGIFAGQWAWFTNGVEPGFDAEVRDLNGMVPTKQEAVDRVKEVWGRWQKLDVRGEK